MYFIKSNKHLWNDLKILLQFILAILCGKYFHYKDEYIEDQKGSLPKAQDSQD